MEEVNSTLRVVELGVTFPDRPYFDSSTLFVFGGDAGITRDVAEHVAIGGELSLRYTPKPGQVGAGTGLRVREHQRHRQPLVDSDQRVRDLPVLAAWSALPL